MGMDAEIRKGVRTMSGQNTNCAYRYTVRRGDSFYLIAQRQGVQLRDLLEANPNIPPARLMVGDVLCVPYAKGADQPAGEQENACAYPPCASGNDQNSGSPGSGQSAYVCPANRRAVVQEGQTASDFQRRYNLSYHTLKTANAEKDLDALKGGDVLCIPEENFSCPVPAAVTLGQGDTLDSVADRYQLSVTQLLRANPCLAPNSFTAGAVIRLPD